jgi:hypothetical protein
MGESVVTVTYINTTNTTNTTNTPATSTTTAVTAASTSQPSSTRCRTQPPRGPRHRWCVQCVRWRYYTRRGYGVTTDNMVDVTNRLHRPLWLKIHKRPLLQVTSIP